MNYAPRLVPVLQGVTVAALAAAAVLLVWPPQITVAPLAPTLPALAAAAPLMSSTDTALTSSIVNANIFSLTREAPEERTFAAAPSDGVVEDVTAGSYGADAGVSDSAALSPEGDRVPSLHGVVDGPMGRAALLRLDPESQGSRLFHLGEGAAGYRVRSIGADRVELAGPSGSIVLTLAVRGPTP